MHYKIEPTGCEVYEGMVQVKFSLYLGPGDYGYKIHYVQVPVVPDSGYPGEVDADGRPVDQAHFDIWLDSLPLVWQNNPFHNHGVLIEPTATDQEIMDQGQAYLEEAYIKWARGLVIDCRNYGKEKHDNIDAERIRECEAKLQHIKELPEARLI